MLFNNYLIWLRTMHRTMCRFRSHQAVHRFLPGPFLHPFRNVGINSFHLSSIQRLPEQAADRSSGLRAHSSNTTARYAAVLTFPSCYERFIYSTCPPLSPLASRFLRFSMLSSSLHQSTSPTGPESAAALVMEHKALTRAWPGPPELPFPARPPSSTQRGPTQTVNKGP